LRAAAIEGVGLIQVPTFSLCEDVRRGRLVPVLTDYPIRELTVHALYAPGAAPNAKLRAFIDLLAKAWAGVPPWERGLEERGGRGKRK
jgi:DNA-binding transcriptional LysR family regulator